MEGDDICLTDSGTTHVILKSKEYFLKLTLNGENFIIIYLEPLTCNIFMDYFSSQIIHHVGEKEHVFHKNAMK